MVVEQVAEIVGGPGVLRVAAHGALENARHLVLPGERVGGGLARRAGAIAGGPLRVAPPLAPVGPRVEQEGARARRLVVGDEAGDHRLGLREEAGPRVVRGQLEIRR